MNIVRATRAYEDWMRRVTPIVEADLRTKHSEMRADAFLFFRGTYYRWAQRWAQECGDLGAAPEVLAVGDLHVGSFGTWRDVEGRLVWGVDDFDEAYPLPYTNDLVRLATSVKIVVDAEALTIRLRDGCEAILDGYRETLRCGGRPLVLAEQFETLEKLGLRALEPPPDFWKELDACRTVRRGVPSDALRALRASLPEEELDYRIARRTGGVGSRGQQRFVAIAEYRGARIAREAKAAVPSASEWLRGGSGTRQRYYQAAMEGAVRAPDPFQRATGRWIIRRLAPDSNPVDIAALSRRRDESKLLHAMGVEAANVHLGTARAAKIILRHLSHQRSGWLKAAARKMASKVREDWKRYVDG